ncbi:hypothetical protein IW492_03265 [Enterococcus sp. BWB1-3]|uniref:pectate lyase-like adhesive domain-containing protein n=1 Tax=Enterococcus sp. BWB1-3 TaxID=2787713 RepID=UPI001923457C|nr:pectate lyase-like adhesive domain-containing protein [Enterococcus sp. BWB1-3]MBL1228253.1 hypothetical protein [Enterococcus sp. BWB1-3]
MKKITKLLLVITFLLTIGYLYKSAMPIEAKKDAPLSIQIKPEVLTLRNQATVERTQVGTNVQSAEEINSFTGETVMVSTMDEFKEAVSRSEVSIISVQENLVGSSASMITINRSLLILGNDYTLNFNGLYFQLGEVAEPSVFRMKNAMIAKSGTTPLVNASAEASGNWTFELEDIQEVDANTMQLAALPQGVVHFTGGNSSFIRSQSTRTFIEAKEIIASNHAEVVISRGNTAVFFSSAAVSSPKVTIEDGASVSITTAAPTAGVWATANTIDLRGDNPELLIQTAASLMVSTIGTTASPTNTNGNTIALVGANPKVSVFSGGNVTISSTAAKRGIFLSGEEPKIQVDDGKISTSSATREAIFLSGNQPSVMMELGELNVVSTTGKGINLSGDQPSIVIELGELNVTATTGEGIYLSGKEPKIIAQDSKGIVESTSGQRVNLQGDNSQVLLTNSVFNMNAAVTGGRTFLMNGTAPEMRLNNSDIVMTGMTGIDLLGTDASLLLENKSKIDINTGGSVINGDDISIGNRTSNPTLKLSGGSEISINNPGRFTMNSGRAIYVNGEGSQVDISGESTIDITAEDKDGILFWGDNVDMSIVDSEVIVKAALDKSAIGGSLGEKGSTVVKDSKIHVLSGQLWFVAGETIVIDNSEINSPRFLYNALETVIKNHSYLELHHDGTRSGSGYQVTHPIEAEILQGVMGSSRLEAIEVTIQTNAIVDIQRTDYNTSTQSGGLRNRTGTIVTVESGGKLSIYTEKQGTTTHRVDAVRFVGDNGNLRSGFIVRDMGSEVRVHAKDGAAITNVLDFTKFDVDLEVSNYGYFEARGNTDSNLAIFDIGAANIIFDNPLFLDFRNDRQGGGRVFSTTANSQLTGINSDLALWEGGSDLDGDPYLNFRNLDYQFSGVNLRTLVSTSNEEELNTSTIGATGLQEYARISSNNGRWAIADELRVPTNADKHIYGRVSVPVGLEATRPAWTDEAEVIVEVERKNGSLEEYTATTVGHTKDEVGLSVYGEEPRGGLFDIELDEFLEAGDKVRIKEVKLVSGELTPGMENLILTDTVEVFPIVPPKPAEFSSKMIGKTAAGIQGHSENKEVEVTAAHNGQAFDTSGVTVDDDGNFTIDLTALTLEEDDIIQVFLRDNEGLAGNAGVIAPPATNNERGNINPAESFDFHDTAFEPAATLMVTRASVLTAVFVNEENQVMPGYTLTIGEGQAIDTALNVGDVIDLTGSEFQAVQDQLTALETAGYEISVRPENETNFSITETAQTVTYKVTGQLFLKSAPSTVDFGSITYNAKVQRVDNPGTDGDLVVTDTRANQAAGWTLYAALTTNMKNDKTGSIMNEALWYVDSAGEELSLTLDSGSQPIYTNASGGTFDVTGTWGGTSAEPGLKLVADPTKTTVSSTGNYSGVVTWTIMAGQP